MCDGNNCCNLVITMRINVKQNHYGVMSVTLIVVNSFFKSMAPRAPYVIKCNVPLQKTAGVVLQHDTGIIVY